MLPKYDLLITTSLTFMPTTTAVSNYLGATMHPLWLPFASASTTNTSTAATNAPNANTTNTNPEDTTTKAS